MTCPCDDRLRPYHPNSIAAEEGDLHAESVADLRLMLDTNPYLFVPHAFNDLSNPLSAPYYELDLPPPSVHSSYTRLSIGREPSDDIPADCGDLDFPRSSDTSAYTYDAWGSFQPPHSPPPSSAFEVSPSTFYDSTSDATLCSNIPCQQPRWSTSGIIQIISDDDYPSFPKQYHSPSIPSFPVSSASLRPDEDPTYRSGDYSGTTMGASYACLWTEGGVTCNSTVQATRSHMNRHLHAHHGFGGSDTRQTRCRWPGCEETMQQGSIARHMVTCHLQAKVTCPMCSKKLSRRDVISKHRRVCPAACSWR